MYINIKMNDEKYRYHIYQIFNIFYTFDDIKVNENKDFNYEVEIGEVTEDKKLSSDNLNNKIRISNFKDEEVYTLTSDNIPQEIKRSVFKFLSKTLNKVYPWGTLVGIRPSKIASDMILKGHSDEEVINYFDEVYLASKEKAELCVHIAKREMAYMNKNDKTIAIYIGMAFCPTRCLYCSFTADPIGKCKNNEVELYIEAIKKEIKAITKYVADNEITVDNVYFGGGTPTSIGNEQFESLMNDIYNSFVKDNNLIEFTVESGRPDSITEEKLLTMKKYDVTRISINPQSMNDKTLKSIGRGHLSGEVIEKFNLARKLGFDNINMDLIIGLPDESMEEVRHTVKEIKALNPDSLTVHGLSIKRASKLYENLVLKETVKIAEQKELNEMYEASSSLGKELDMEPYYMYRQKNMVGNMENVGYSKEGQECYYNIQMIEDTQSIIAIGADAVSKVVFLSEGKGRIERFANVKNVKEYINRADEMIEGKLALLDTLYK
ncbi:coproporphyrinogen III oxidase [uncultured Clostridium sp.]|uniref:coproporphyrinogen III oxidase n=1 Tax=uncultured Clostridium sp. TaxID=59620 RepID=UPI00263797DB|nr:coproporphyrinogen III oxidase [uncultured Clostridium sp.]